MMSRRGRWVAMGLVIAAVSLVVWVLLRGPAQPPREPASAPGRPTAAAPAPQPTPTPKAQIPAVEAERTTITTADEQGRRQWEIHADLVVVDSASNTAQLTSVKGTYYQKGEAVVTFAAPRGTFFILTRNVTLTGRVRAQSPSGRTMDAETVKWFMKTQTIEATGSVVLRQQGLTAHADRVTTDLRLRTARLQGNVRVDVAE